MGPTTSAAQPTITLPRRWSDPHWKQHKRDARRLGTTADNVASFKTRLNLPQGEPLTAAAGALLLLELQTAARVSLSEAIEQAQARQLIAQRATPEAAAALAAVVPEQAALLKARGSYVGNAQADAFLLHRLEALTGKRYASPGTARKRCEAWAPAAASAAAGLDSFRRALFWGVVLRFDQLEGPPPADPLAFYSWSQLAAFAGHGGSPVESLGDLLAGRMQEQRARTLLQLPASGPLPAVVIRDAFRAQARQYHPDTGGDRHRFEQLAAARDRLLMGG